MEFPGKAVDKIAWIVDRDRQTRNKARTLFQQGFPWGEAIIRALEHHLVLEWKITGLGVSQGSVQLAA
eukprot:5627845-Pyramimonas_sp.AAC.1